VVRASEPYGAARKAGRTIWLRVAMGALVAALCVQTVSAQRVFTWQEIRDKFEAQNPTLRAGEIGISESRMQEITAFLRPNPDLMATIDQIDRFTTNPYRPTTNTVPFGYVAPASQLNLAVGREVIQ
jgi:cobalt-zinc-cadmium efflux system outer membrane protein